MTPQRDVDEEQAFLDLAYASLDAMRRDAEGLRDSVLDLGRGGTFQSRTERDIVVRGALARLAQLDVGEQPLCFGRIDFAPAERGAEPEAFHIGRLAIASEDRRPLVVDWRAPIAEPFYRATGRDPLGLVRRRHLSVKYRTVLGVEDEFFTDADGTFPTLGDDAAAAVDPDGLVASERPIGGAGALFAALGRARSGQMGDIVATIQGEQDEIIRAPLAGALLVQGGPGTGKTAVALHRAAYLLYTHRFPLEGQGVLVVGPNPLFLRYIEQVLPSLGESGVTLSTVAGLVTAAKVAGIEDPELERLKGGAVMAQVIARAIRLRQRRLRAVAEVPFGASVLRCTPEQSATIIARAERRPGSHNLRRRFVEAEIVKLFAKQLTERNDPDDEPIDLKALRAQLRTLGAFIDVLDRMWPRLSPHELLHDLYGALPLLNAAAKNLLRDDEIRALVRPRSSSLDEVPWTTADLALIDEAQALLGPRHEGSKRRHDPDVARDGGRWPEGLDGRDLAPMEMPADEIRAFGHIVVDEVQDLSAMQLRMLQRRSLTGSMTVVGDIAQSTSPGSLGDWDAITAQLCPNRAVTTVELTVSYRTPAEVLEMAAVVLAIGAPDLVVPTPVRRSGHRPRYVRTDVTQRLTAVVALAQEELEAVGEGRVAVLVPQHLMAATIAAFTAAEVEIVDPRHGGARGLGAALVILPVEDANGLEFDAVIILEPAIVARRESGDGAETHQGMRTLYVAMTRPTRRLTLLATEDGPVDFSAWRVS